MILSSNFTLGNQRDLIHQTLQEYEEMCTLLWNVFLTWMLSLSSEALWNFMVIVAIITSLLTIYLLMGAIAYFLVTDLPRHGLNGKRVLLVTAHPIDECMFFGPTILKLRNICDIYLLCLSNRDRYMRDSKSKNELWNCCDVLGIPRSNITLMSLTLMPNDPKLLWNHRRVGRIVTEEIETRSIEVVFTFDIGGANLNHISLFQAFANLCLNNDIPINCKVYVLETVNILRKYGFFMDALMTLFPWSGMSFICNFNEHKVIKSAVRQHESQLVWSRRLYMYISRYMFLNTYQLLDPEDAALQLQIAGLDGSPPGRRRFRRTIHTTRGGVVNDTGPIKGDQGKGDNKAEVSDSESGEDIPGITDSDNNSGKDHHNDNGEDNDND